jgi:CheY-like chemotaxis protein
MGLAVVDGIIKKHDGAIHIESEVGKGTTVEVLFPVIEAQENIEINQQETPLAGTERILLIDDEPSVLKTVAKMIERYGYEVVQCSSGSEALDLFRLQPNRFDLVITDMTLPMMSGDRLSCEMMGIRPDVPIILCTGHSERIDEERAQELGIQAFIMKPFSRRAIVKTIQEVLKPKVGVSPFSKNR